MYSIGPPIISPRLSSWRYLTARRDSAYFVAIPTKAVIHIQQGSVHGHAPRAHAAGGQLVRPHLPAAGGVKGNAGARAFDKERVPAEAHWCRHLGLVGDTQRHFQCVATQAEALRCVKGKGPGRIGPVLHGQQQQRIGLLQHLPGPLPADAVDGMGIVALVGDQRMAGAVPHQTRMAYPVGIGHERVAAGLARGGQSFEPHTA